DLALVALQAIDLSSLIQVIEANGRVPAGRGSPAAVAADGHSLQFVSVACKRMHLLADLQVPQAHGMVMAAGQEPPAVRSNGHTRNKAKALKVMQFLARFQVPETDGPIRTTSQYVTLVRAENKRTRAVGSHVDECQLLGRGHVPHANRVVFAEGDESTAVPKERHSAHLVVVAEELAHLADWVGRRRYLHPLDFRQCLLPAFQRGLVDVQLQPLRRPLQLQLVFARAKSKPDLLLRLRVNDVNQLATLRDYHLDVVALGRDDQ